MPALHEELTYAYNKYIENPETLLLIVTLTNICLRANLSFPICRVISECGQSWLSIIIYSLSLWAKFVSLPFPATRSIYTNSLCKLVAAFPLTFLMLWEYYILQVLFSVYPKNVNYIFLILCVSVSFSLPYSLKLSHW